MTARIAIIATVGLLLAAFVQTTAGTPIQGTEVGLEGDPGSIAVPVRTDARGAAAFSVGPGRYSVFLTNPTAPAVVTVTPVNDAPSMASAAIRPGRGRVYAVDSSGRRLTTVVPRGGGRVRLTLTEAGSRTPVTSVSTGGQSGSDNGAARATVNSSGAVIAAEASAPRGTAASSGGPIDIEAWSWSRIDRVNTVQACTARQGEVVMHQGVQQCRLPAPGRSEGGDVVMQLSTTR